MSGLAGPVRRQIAGAYRRPSVRIKRILPDIPKVITLHDHAIIAEVLTVMLAARVDIVAETQSGKAAVALSELLTPDVVVVGETLIDGVVEYYVPALLQTGTRVLLVSQALEAARALELVELGITGIISYDQSPLELGTAVITLASGGAVLPTDVVGAIAADWRRSRRNGGDKGARAELTGRELEVLGAMSDGMSTKAVAHHLGIALKTVENHKTRIFDKLGVRTQAQAVAVAIGLSASPVSPPSVASNGRSTDS